MSRNGSGQYNLVVNSWYPPVAGVSATPADWQTFIEDVAAALTQSISADGQTPITGNLAMGGNKLTGLAAGTATGQSLRFEQLFDQGVEADIASAATTDIGVQNTNFLRITGTTTITSFGTNYRGPRFVRFAGALTLTHNASTLILPTGANITTAAGDRAIIVPKATTGTADGWQVLAYQRADGQALVASQILDTTRIDVASAATVDLTANAPNTRHINITGTTTITAFTIAVGLTYFVRFNASLTLTNNASIVTQTGANITTQAGDTCIIRATSANVVEVLSYVGYASSAQAVARTEQGRLITASNFSDANIVLDTPTTFSTQTAIDSGAIPSWAKRIHVVLQGLSTSGTSVPIIQLADAGGPENSGYFGAVSTVSGTGSASANHNTGFLLAQAVAAASIIHGVVTLTRLDSSGTIWAVSGTLGNSNAAATQVIGGVKVLSAALTGVRLTTVNGTDQFDNTGSGQVNFMWE